jgi:hypothetical protein
MPDVTVAASLARGMLDFAVARGGDRAAVEAAAGLSLADLQDLDSRIEFSAYKRLVRAAQASCGDPALSLRYGAQVDMAEGSIVGLIMNAAPTMGDAFLQMQRYGRLAVEFEGQGDAPRYTRAVRYGKHWIVENRFDAADFQELSESAFARLACGPRRFLPQAHILEAHFA